MRDKEEIIKNGFESEEEIDLYFSNLSKNKIKEIYIPKKNCFTRKDILEIIDNCFHTYASSFRNEAREMAEELMKSKIDNKTDKKKGC